MNEKEFSTQNAKSEDDVISFYDKYADDWDARFGDSVSTKSFIERRWSVFADVVGECVKSKNVAVELGVGTGVYIRRCADLFGKIVAVDGSANMLANLSAKIKKSNICNVDLMCENVVNLKGIENSSADCVYFFGLVEHIIDMSSFVSEIRRILRPGGVVIGVTPNGLSPWYFLRSLVRGTGKHCSSDTYHTAKSLDRAFAPLGFSRIKTVYWGMVPAGVNDKLANVMKTIEPFVEKTPMRYFLGGLTFAYRC